MAKKTIKVTFDENDSTYKVISEYGKRFGARAGTSIAARVLLDQACGSTPAFKPVTAEQPLDTPLPEEGKESPTFIQPEDDGAGKIETQKHSDLLAGIRDFKERLCL